MSLALALLLLAAATSTHAWNLKLLPSGAQLTNRKIGENFLVVCQVEGFDGPASEVRVDWQKSNEVIRAEGGRIMTIERPLSSQLMIVHAKKTDSGDYTCQAKINGELQYMAASINFIKTPEFVEPKKAQHPEEGKDAEIVCKVDAEEGVEIFWQFNGATLGETSTREYDFKDNKQILVIPRYESKKDDGVYLCNAALHSSFETLPINVTGYSRPTITVFDVPEKNLGYEGQSTQFKCQAVGKPKPTYKWFKVAEDEEITQSDIYTVSDGLLVINALSGGDSGDYKCVASNDIGEAEKIASLDVFLKPVVEKMSNEVKEDGEEVTFTCKYSAEGNVRAKFLFNNEVFEVKSTESTTAFAEKASEEEKEEETKDGENEEDEETTTTTVNDEDEEEEEENRRWKRFVSDVTEERIVVSEKEHELVLKVRKLSQSDAGSYQCVVENEAGSSTRTASLAITHAPVITGWTEGKTRSFDGHSFTLHCDVSAVPDATWKWMRDGDEVEADGAAVVIDSGSHSSRLTIKSTREDHYGEFSCIAENGVGQPAEKKMTVLRIMKPRLATVAPSCMENIYPNYGHCRFPAETFSTQSKPLKVTFYYADQAEAVEGFNWEEDAANVTVEYSDEAMRIPQLDTNKAYVVRAIASNEAGESELSPASTIETTDPWAPELPDSVTTECDKACSVEWKEPNDHGAPITHYIITVKEMKDVDEDEEEEAEKEFTGVSFEFRADADDDSYELTNLKPLTTYEVSVQAANAIGHSAATSRVFKTPDTLRTPLESLASPQWVAIAVVALIILGIVIDVLLFFVANCGLLACFCSHCLGRKERTTKPKDIESGRGESNRLLEGSTR